jgi:hypothetical protein
MHISGKFIKSFEINPNNSSIDIRDVENGIYIVTLNNSSFLKSQKLIVNHEK